MADLLSILANSATGLAAHQAAVATAGHNMQNVNTPGYARQRAELEATSPAQFLGNAYIGRGVALQTISQARDPFIERQMPNATAAQARSGTESDALASVTALDPDGAGSLTNAVAAFYSAMRGLSQNPGDGGLRRQVLASSRALALGVNRASGDIEAARSGLDAKLAGNVADANHLAATVAGLNRQIQIARAGGAEPNDLLDARQEAANKLSALTGAAQVPTGTGDLQLILSSGGALVSGANAGALSLLADPGNGGHAGFQLTRADGSGPTAVGGRGFGGTIGGVVDARDGALLTAVNSLDQLAFDFTATVNAVHVNGVGLDGATGRNLFVAQATVGGAASRMALDAAVADAPDAIGAAFAAGSLPGDGRNALLMIQTESAALSGGKDAGSTLAGIVTDFGASAARASALHAQDTTVLGNLTNQRESVSGVSLDEEMVNLTKSQRAYQAVIKVITTADEMLDTLMTIAGR